MQYLGHILDEKFKIKNSFKEKFKKKKCFNSDDSRQRSDESWKEE